MRLMIVLFFVVACATVVKPPEPVKHDEPEEAIIALKMPTLNLPDKSSGEMAEAKDLYEKHGNSEEFYTYFAANVKPLQGGNYTDSAKAIKDFRKCLNERSPIQITWKNYGVWPLYKSAAIGGWNGVSIQQNPKKNLDKIDRAGHWYHETTHVCGFSHISNNIVKYPIIKQSFPYQAGYLFITYLKTLK